MDIDKKGFEKIILGIDPGTNIMGYGLLGINKGKYTLISTGIVHLVKLESQSDKLRKIFDRTLWLIDQFHPDEMAIESQFFGKNIQSMLKLGRAQGVAIAAALYRDIPVFEYAPRKIKQSVTGNGNATKEQVASMLQRLLNIQDMPSHMDASDALAIALCHYFQNSSKVKAAGKQYGSWSSFLADNPGRVK